jgi:hypothetical protein
MAAQRSSDLELSRDKRKFICVWNPDAWATAQRRAVWLGDGFEDTTDRKPDRRPKCLQAIYAASFYCQHCCRSVYAVIQKNLRG